MIKLAHALRMGVASFLAYAKKIEHTAWPLLQQGNAKIKMLFYFILRAISRVASFVFKDSLLS